MSTEFIHHSVLLSQTIAALQPQPGGAFIDCTLGGGGHSELLLTEAGSTAKLIAIDRDLQAITAAQKRLAPLHEQICYLHGPFAEVLSQLKQRSFDSSLCPEWTETPTAYDGIVIDLGVSSPQLDHPNRGFSFQHDGPLDMRMDQSSGLSAAEWLEQIDEIRLANVLFQYGEEPRSRRIARAIIAGRPWHRTAELAECIAKASGYKKSRTHPATRSFQAIRIAVNQELEQLKHGLRTAFDLLKCGGHLCVISFHSLEDRFVKHSFRQWAAINSDKDAYGNPLDPICASLHSRKGIAGKQADPENPRARSARLRGLQKLRELPSENSSHSTSANFSI